MPYLLLELLNKHSGENCNWKLSLELEIDFSDCENMTKNTNQVIKGNNFRTLQNHIINKIKIPESHIILQ